MNDRSKTRDYRDTAERYLPMTYRHSGKGWQEGPDPHSLFAGHLLYLQGRVLG